MEKLSHMVCIAQVCIALLLFSIGTVGTGCAATSKTSAVKAPYDVIVVGAGLGGLTAATSLTKAKLKVLVLEQSDHVGGCTSAFARGEFQFDAALHQMSLGGNEGTVRTILREIGAADRVELIPTPELARSVFPGLDFVTPSSIESARAAFKARWPSEAKDIDAFLELAENISNELVELSALSRMSKAQAGWNLLLVPFRQPNLFRWRNATLKDVFERYFDDPDLELVLSQYWLYFGPPPSRIWAPMFLLGYYSYLKNGAWQVRGSSAALSQALADKIKSTGGELRTNTRVTKILVEGGRAQGVVTANRERIMARYVISNADPFQTFRELVGAEHMPKETMEQLASLRPSNSLVGVYLGLDVTPQHWGVPHFEVFYHSSSDTDAMYQAMIEGRYNEGAVSIALYGNLNDPYYAPPRKSVVVLNAYSSRESWPAERGPQYDAQKTKMMDQLIALAEQVLPGLREHIVVQEGLTPLTIHSYTLQTGGVPYGFDMVPGNWRNRFANVTPIDGLYLAGSWAGLIHGAAGAMISGYRASQLVMDAEKK